MQKSPDARSSHKQHRFMMLLAAAVLLTSIVPAASFAAQAPAYVRVKLLKGGLLLGGASGSGVVTYRGMDYPFAVSALSLGFTAGISYIWFKGWARGIRTIGDFAGTYSMTGSGGAVIGGFGGVQLVNDKGVTMALGATRVGVELAINLGQVTIKLKE